MNSFILKILFSGMIVFSPNQNGTEVTVLLLNAGHTHHLSDGSALQDHKPLLIARAGNCTAAAANVTAANATRPRRKQKA